MALLTVGALLHDHLVRLLVAAGLSVVSGLVIVGVRPPWRSFGTMTAAWGAIDAVLSLAGLRGGPPQPGLLPFIAFNEGLDAGYVGVGLAMVLLAGGRERIKGFGLAVAIQGALLLLLDGKLWSDLVRLT